MLNVKFVIGDKIRIKRDINRLSSSFIFGHIEKGEELTIDDIEMNSDGDIIYCFKEHKYIGAKEEDMELI